MILNQQQRSESNAVLKPYLVVASAILFTFSVRIVAADEPTRIYIGNDDHTDFMWTADADTYADAFVEMLDFHLNLADETDANPAPYRNRFNCDGSYWLWNYEHKKTPAEFERLVDRIKDGTISAPLNSLVSCYGGQPAEAVLRGMYYSGRLERQHGLRFPLAVAMENQTLPLGLASLFAGSGARYSWRGVCGCASKMKNDVLERRSGEIYWWTGRDGRRLLLKWHSLAPSGNQNSGGYAEAFDPVKAIRYLDSDQNFLNLYRALGAREPYQVRAAFGFGWDALDRKTGQPYKLDPAKYPMVDHFHVIAQQQSTPQRQVIVSNEADFFLDFEKNHSDSLQTESLTYGNEWDLYSASMSETSARVKRAVEKMRSAELLAAYVSLKKPGFLNSYREASVRAFIGLGLFWEHNWTADGPISRERRAAWQEKLAEDIESYVDSIFADGVKQLGSLIEAPGNHFYVLNPLGWKRTDAADLAYSGGTDIHVRDVTSGDDVPFQFVTKDGKQYLRVLASDVPPAGYKVFDVSPGKGNAVSDDAAIVSGDGNSIFENERVKLVIQRDGAISSLIDKRQSNVELAAKIDGLWINDFAPKSDSGESLVVENRGPVSVTIRAQSRAGLEHNTTITLVRDSDRIDIANELKANFRDVRHWAFSFGLKSPIIHTEEVGAVILDKLKSDGGDYADSQARYDYVTVNHFADISDGSDKQGVTISNPDLAFARLGRSLPSNLDVSTSQINLLAGGQVDGPTLGIPSQAGNRYFSQRFALQSHGNYVQAAAMKCALEHQNPLVTGMIGENSGTRAVAYPPTSFSLLEISEPQVLLWALKVHEDGIENGLVARIWNQSAEQESFRFKTMPLKSVRLATHLETPLEQLDLHDSVLETSVQSQRMETYVLEFQ